MGYTMTRYIILSRFSSDAYKHPKEFKQIATEVATEIKKKCPGVTWIESYATTGRFDVVDIIESNDIIEVEKTAMIIRSLGHSTTETLVATRWKDFLGSL